MNFFCFNVLTCDDPKGFALALFQTPPPPPPAAIRSCREAEQTCSSDPREERRVSNQHGSRIVHRRRRQLRVFAHFGLNRTGEFPRVTRLAFEEWQDVYLSANSKNLCVSVRMWNSYLEKRSCYRLHTGHTGPKEVQS